MAASVSHVRPTCPHGPAGMTRMGLSTRPGSRPEVPGKFIGSGDCYASLRERLREGALSHGHGPRRSPDRAVHRLHPNSSPGPWAQDATDVPGTHATVRHDGGPGLRGCAVVWRSTARNTRHGSDFARPGSPG